MSTDENSQWVNEVNYLYRDYCNNLMSSQTGLDAILGVLFITHGFEGEVREDIKKICDSMIAEVGYYGAFVLSISAQDSLLGMDEKILNQQCFVDTIEFVKGKKNSAITGYDNYCYVTGTLVTYQQYRIETSITSYYKDKGSDRLVYKGEKVTPWKVTNITDPSKTTTADMNVDAGKSIGNIKGAVLLNQYMSVKGDTELSLTDYLKSMKVLENGDCSKVVTTYTGVKQFNTDDGLEMECHKFYGDYFRNGFNYRINQGNSSKIVSKRFVVKDKVVLDYMDATKDNMGVYQNQILMAVALYQEDHGYWITDEMHAFSKGGKYTMDKQVYEESSFWGDIKHITQTYFFSDEFCMLQKEEVPKSSFSTLTVLKDAIEIPDPEPEKDKKKDKLTVEPDWSKSNMENITDKLDDEAINTLVNKEYNASVERAKSQGVDV